MSKFSKYSTKESVETREFAATAETNFMGGTSYKLNPLDTLRIVAASSIFGEPQYYRDGVESPKTLSRFMSETEHDIFNTMFDSKSATDVFTEAIDNALTHDFLGTLNFAVRLRNEYNMRLNPAVIYVRATQHPFRIEFNESNPGVMKSIGKAIAGRPDDLTNQLDYYMYLNGSKKGLPSILKRTWAERLAEYSRYQLNKYKGKSLIDLVRISHAHSEDITELVQTGTIKVLETEQTWEKLRSEGKSWSEIIKTIQIPHMALLRNLRGIFTEINGAEGAKVLEQLKSGVKKGKQFPFRYWSAYKAIQKAEVNNKGMVLDALEECMDISVANMPKINGKVACLSDNSGSAWGTCTSEYGSVTVAEIANLSSLITAQQSDEGYVGVFGDNLSLNSVSKRNGLLTQLKETTKLGQEQGQATENGIWLFWDKAIREKQYWDTVFIYSDMQAGHGGLFGENPSEYSKYIYEGRPDRYIDVLALVKEYRKKVNPKVNVFTVQVAGYNNTLLPENFYRGAVLAGWTGREPQFAKEIINTWDSIEENRK
jgi:hypothetical protein